MEHSIEANSEAVASSSHILESTVTEIYVN